MEAFFFPYPKKFKQATFIGKVIASIFFFTSKGIIMIDYLENGKTINRQYYASELRQLKEVIKLKYREKLRAGALLLQDNIPVHTSQVAEAANYGF